MPRGALFRILLEFALKLEFQIIINQDTSHSIFIWFSHSIHTLSAQFRIILVPADQCPNGALFRIFSFWSFSQKP